MPIDPQTGMWSNAVQYQPSGAMGAVIELLNAQKGQEIANTLQQEREAQAGMSQAQLGEYQEKHDREQRLRDLMASMKPDAQGNPPTFDQRINAAIGSGLSDLSQWAPYARAGESARARLGTAEIKSRSDMGRAFLAGGGTMADLPRFLHGLSVPDEQMPEVFSGMGLQGSLPVPEATAKERTAIGEAATTNAATRQDRAKHQNALDDARASLDRIIGQVKQRNSVSGSEAKWINQQITKLDEDIAKENNSMAALINPAATKAQIERYETRKQELYDLLKSKLTGADKASTAARGSLGASPEQKAKATGTQNPTAAPASVWKFNPATGTIEP